MFVKKDREECEPLKTSVAHKAYSFVLLASDKVLSSVFQGAQSSKLLPSCMSISLLPSQMALATYLPVISIAPNTVPTQPFTTVHSLLSYLSAIYPLSYYSIPLPLCYLLTNPSFHSSIHPPIHASTHPSLLSLIHPLIYPFTHSSFTLSIYLHIHLTLFSLPHSLINPSANGFVHSPRIPPSQSLTP